MADGKELKIVPLSMRDLNTLLGRIKGGEPTASAIHQTALEAARNGAPVISADDFVEVAVRRVARDLGDR